MIAQTLAADRQSVGRCPCGLARYLSRQDARYVARVLYPGQRRRAFACGTYWHFGLLPNHVRQGVSR